MMLKALKEIPNFMLHGEVVTVYEVENLDDLLDANRSVRPIVVRDVDALRALVTVKNMLLVSRTVELDAVLAQARTYPGESFLDAVLNCVEKQ